MTKKLSFVVGGIACLALLFGIGFWYKAQQKAIFDAGVDKAYAGTLIASQGSYNESVSVFFHRIATQKNPPSIADLQRLEALCGDSNFFHRSRAISTLSYLTTPEAKAITITQAHKQLKDVERVVRGSALSALNRVNAPDLRAAAEQMKNDPSPDVRKMAEKILSKS